MEEDLPRLRITLGLALVWSLSIAAQDHVDIDRDRKVIPLVLQQSMLLETCQAGNECWLEVTYRASPSGPELHYEPGERVWWLGQVPMVVLGASGQALPRSVLNRTELFVEMWIEGNALSETPSSIFPAKQSVPVHTSSADMTEALKQALAIDVDASYLAQVANYMAGNVNTLAVQGTSYELDGETIINEDGLFVPGNYLNGSSGNILAEGPGTRLLWYPAKASFRAGRIDANQWDETNIGVYSYAFGNNNEAGNSCFVTGGNNSASSASTILGFNNTSTGVQGFIVGHESLLTGFYNTILGYANSISGSFVQHNFVLGTNSSASGNHGFALGRRARAMHDGVFVWGDHTDADIESTADDQFLVRATGGMGIGTNQPAAQLHVNDSGSLLPFRVDVNGTRYLQLRDDGRLVVGPEDAHGPSDDVLNVEAPASTHALRVRLAGVTKLRVHDNGGTSIGVNTTPPANGLHVNGNVSKGGGSFKIDHPLDPQNKYLYHSFVESPDMMNIYNGRVTLDARGEAVVTLPDYFQALNRTFRYQLTPMGSPSVLYIAREISARQFTIAGGNPGQDVCWTVTGIRQDHYANANRIPVEELKPPEERGSYLHPKAFGLKNAKED